MPFLQTHLRGQNLCKKILVSLIIFCQKIGRTSQLSGRAVVFKSKGREFNSRCSQNLFLWIYNNFDFSIRFFYMISNVCVIYHMKFSILEKFGFEKIQNLKFIKTTNNGGMRRMYFLIFFWNLLVLSLKQKKVFEILNYSKLYHHLFPNP